MAFKDVSNPFKYKAHYDAKIRGYYDPAKRMITFKNPEGGYAAAYFADLLYTENFSLDIYNKIIITGFANEGYNLNKILVNGVEVQNMTEYEVLKDLELSVEVSKQSILVELQNDDNSVITVTHNGVDHTSSFYIDYGDYISISASTTGDGNEIKNIYMNGEVITPGEEYQIKSNVTISANSGKVTLNVIINKTDHSTIRVLYGDTTYTDNFQVKYGDTIKVNATTDENQGYALNEILANNDILTQNSPYTVTEDIEIKALVYFKQITVDIQQPENGQISVYDGTNHTTSFTIPWGSTISVSCTTDSNFYVENLYMNARTITQNREYVLKDDNVLLYTTIKEVDITRYFTINLEQDIEHGHLVGYYMGQTYTETFQVPEGGMVTVWPEPDEGYEMDTFFINNQPQEDNPTYIFLAIMDYNVSCTFRTVETEPVVPPKTYYKLQVNKNEPDTVYNLHINDILSGNAVYSYEVGTKLYIKPSMGTSVVVRNININGTTLNMNQYGEYEYTINNDSVLNINLGVSIDITQPANGNISITCAAAGLNNAIGTHFVIPYNAAYTLTATPNNGYKVTSFTVTPY